jgi:hypothetical protein
LAEKDMKQQERLLACMASFLVYGCVTINIPDPHAHVVDVHAKPWLTEMAPDAVVMKVYVCDKIARNNIITNQSGAMLAFTVPVKQGPPDWQVEYAYFQTIETDDLWVILGIPMEYRPFSDLIWVNNRYLVFDRWSNHTMGCITSLTHHGRNYCWPHLSQIRVC